MISMNVSIRRGMDIPALAKALRAAGITRIRTDALSYENIAGSIPPSTELRDLIQRENIDVLCLISSRAGLVYDDTLWDLYATSAALHAKIAGVREVQIFERVNTERACGVAPDPEECWSKFCKTRYTMLSANTNLVFLFPSIAITRKTMPGLVMDPREYLAKIIELVVSPGSTFGSHPWTFSFLQSDGWHSRKKLYECLEMVKGHARIVETGSVTDKARWFSMIRKGIGGVDPRDIYWRCWNKDGRYGIVRADGTVTPALVAMRRAWTVEKKVLDKVLVDLQKRLPGELMRDMDRRDILEA